MIENINQLIEDIKEINYWDEEKFNNWKDNVEIFFTNFPEDSSHWIIRFSNIKFEYTGSGLSIHKDPQQNAFEKGKKRAILLLEKAKKRLLEILTNEGKKNLFIFMLMPFDEKLTKIYERCIKKPLEEKEFIVKRADDFFKSVPIMDDILESIIKADIIIGDLTDKNPNVFYELGRAHEKKDKCVIHICQEKDKIPFDLGHIRTIFYKDTPEGYEKLEKDILKFIETCIKEKIEKSRLKLNIKSNG